MNRPNRDKYRIYDEGYNYSTGFAINDYVEDLEKYCDELEQSNKSLSNAYDDCLVTSHFWEEEYYKYRKALDKACELLICLDCYDCGIVCHIKCDDVRTGEFSCTKEDWKEWLLKDDYTGVGKANKEILNDKN